MILTKNLIIKLIFIFVLFYIENHAQTQLELNNEAFSEYKKQDDELNKIYKEILKIYREDTLFIKKIRAAQKAWIIFRDAHLSSLFPEEEYGYYGSVYPMCYSYKLAEITKKRVEELKLLLEGTEEGDVCSGSIKIKGEIKGIRTNNR